MDYGSPRTLGTFLGPRYEYPVNKMRFITKFYDEDELNYLLYATKNVIGLQKLPLDGNPYKHVAILGHPVKV